MTISAELFAPGSHGLIIPLYIYPDDGGVGDAAWSRVADLAVSYPSISVIVIANPASGPGSRIDEMYRRAIRMVKDAGVLVVGYVPLGYGDRDPEEVQRDIRLWRRLYPGVVGIFFDEVPGSDGGSGGAPESAEGPRESLSAATHAARRGGYTICIGNPGVPVPNWYFSPELFDAVVVWENDRWPPATTVSFGPASSPERAVRSAALVYGDGVWDEERFRRTSRHLGFVFVNDHLRDVTGAGAYPWNYLPDNLTRQAEILSERGR